MKIALGLFHFNPHWNLDPRSAHRHCTEALAPLLQSLIHHPSWKLSIEMSGAGLEFVNRAYPDLFRNLRILVEKGQIELISSLYTPNLWIGFPLRDLVTSVELNRQCLDRLGLPWSRIFFAQEAFFGTGVSALQDYFDIAICKDDYLTHYYDITVNNACFLMRGLKVVVASGHLLSELAGWTRTFNTANRFPLRSEHVQHLEEVQILNDPNSFPAARGAFQNTLWAWYHCGDGNHFGAVYKPDNLEHCYYDPIWSTLCVRRMEALEDEGYHLGTVAQFVDSFDYGAAVELPPLVEGGWNPRRSEGVFCWMGRNDTPWENDAAVLTSISRARKRLVDTTTLAEALGRDDAAISALLNKGWGGILRAQISDSLGWFAGYQAVQSSLLAADEALIAAGQALDALRCDLPDPPETSIPMPMLSEPYLWPEPIFFGAEGVWTYHNDGEGSRVCECRFKVTETTCGVRFPFMLNKLVFCPSGMEDTPVEIPRSILKPISVALPLANGLLQISEEVFLIKDVCSVHVAAIVCFEEKTVDFRIAGSNAGKVYYWRFHVFRGELEACVAKANDLNAV